MGRTIALILGVDPRLIVCKKGSIYGRGPSRLFASSWERSMNGPRGAEGQKETRVDRPAARADTTGESSTFTSP